MFFPSFLYIVCLVEIIQNFGAGFDGSYFYWPQNYLIFFNGEGEGAAGAKALINFGNSNLKFGGDFNDFHKFRWLGFGWTGFVVGLIFLWKVKKSKIFTFLLFVI